MARRRKSLLALLLPKPKPKRRPATRSRKPSVAKSVKPAAARPAATKSASGRSQTSAKVPPGSGTWIEARYVGPAGDRPYSVYRPKSIRRGTAVPLLVLLHGCIQSAAEFAAATRFNQHADRHGFVIVYPHQTVTANLQRCWNWFEPRHQMRLLGEPAIIAGIVARVATETLRWRIDPTRIYVAGLSAGGTMALTLGATYPDLFAAVGVHSAPPYRAASNRATAMAAMAGLTNVPAAPTGSFPGAGAGMPPTIIFQGTSDHTVREANGTRVTEQWLDFQHRTPVGTADPDRAPRSRITADLTGGRTSTVTRWYTPKGRTCLESWRVSGLGHAWSGGLAKGSFSDPKGPRATTVMWRFMSAQRLSYRA